MRGIYEPLAWVVNLIHTKTGLKWLLLVKAYIEDYDRCTHQTQSGAPLTSGALAIAL